MVIYHGGNDAWEMAHGKRRKRLLTLRRVRFVLFALRLTDRTGVEPLSL
jgi:hypothetical protein